jgi:hypothetical protein
MIKLLNVAFTRLRQLPDNLQNEAAAQLIRYVDEIEAPDDTR